MDRAGDYGSRLYASAALVAQFNGNDGDAARKFIEMCTNLRAQQQAKRARQVYNSAESIAMDKLDDLDDEFLTSTLHESHKKVFSSWPLRARGSRSRGEYLHFRLHPVPRRCWE